MLRIMAVASRELSDHLRTHAIVVDYKKRAREALIFSLLCKRLAEDDVYYNDFGRHYFTSRKRYSDVRYRYDYDVKYLSHMTKKIPYWWD